MQFLDGTISRGEQIWLVLGEEENLNRIFLYHVCRSSAEANLWERVIHRETGEWPIIYRMWL